MSHRLFREFKSHIFGTNSPRGLGPLLKKKVFSFFWKFFVLGHEPKNWEHDLGQTATLHGNSCQLVRDEAKSLTLVSSVCQFYILLAFNEIFEENLWTFLDAIDNNFMKKKFGAKTKRFSSANEMKSLQLNETTLSTFI